MSCIFDLFFAQFIVLNIQYAEVINISVFVYSCRPDFIFNLKILIKEEQLSLTLKQFFNNIILCKKFTLNNAQQLSIINALRSCLALIQDSSDINKSYTNVAIIKALLKNCNAVKLESIICVCYTNPTFNQLLKHLIKNDVKQLICLRLRLKSELL